MGVEGEVNRRSEEGNRQDAKGAKGGGSSPGYRIYFGQIGSTIVLLLCGGDKSTQDEDILKAIEYWQDYRSYINA